MELVAMLDDNSDCNEWLPSDLMAAAVDGDTEIDRELEAAIEYKIASCGVAGVERIIDFMNIALRRHANSLGGAGIDPFAAG